MLRNVGRCQGDAVTRPLPKVILKMPSDYGTLVLQSSLRASPRRELQPILDRQHRRPILRSNQGKTAVAHHYFAHALRYGHPNALEAKDSRKSPSTGDWIVLKVSAVKEAIGQPADDNEQLLELNVRRLVRDRV